jgi:hypothetical protein
MKKKMKKMKMQIEQKEASSAGHRKQRRLILCD